MSADLSWMHPVTQQCGPGARWSIRLGVWATERRGRRMNQDQLEQALRRCYGSKDVGDQVAFHGYCHVWAQRYEQPPKLGQ